MIQTHNLKQGSPEWLAARVGKYTGSNAYKLLGSHGVLEYAKAIESEFHGTFWTKRGHILEDEAIELYELIKGVKVERPGFITNDKYPNCLYSPDGILPGKGIEVKSFDLPQHMKLVRGDIDIKIMAQTHFGYLITELPEWELIAYNPHESLSPREQLVIIPIKRNPAILRNFKRILTQEVAHA
jgi:hypothetical protein